MLIINSEYPERFISVLYKAVLTDNWSEIKSLLIQGVKFNQPMILNAANRNQIDVMNLFLDTKSYIPADWLQDAFTAAANLGHVGMVELLWSRAQSQVKIRLTAAAILAAQESQIDIVQLLLKYGADRTKLDKYFPQIMRIVDRLNRYENERIFLYARILSLEQARNKSEVGAVQQALQESLG